MDSDIQAAPRKFLEYFDELLGRLRISILLFIVIFIVTFLFGINKIKISGFMIYYPYPDFYRSISILVIDFIEKKLVPNGFILINISPFDAVVTIAYTSIALGLSVAVPVAIFQILKFSAPALYPNERKAIYLSIIPIILLFIMGILFAILIILPLLFKVIFILSHNLNVLPTMGIKNFITLILLICLGMGVVFETPMVIILLSYLRIVEPKVWFKNWRYAIIGAFFIALLISPGATGGIMEVTIATIIIAMYFVGALVALRVYKK